MFKKLQIKVSYRALLIWGICGIVLQCLGAYLGFKVVPDLVRKKVLETKVLTTHTQQWDIFMKIPFYFDFKIYFFEIQNPDDILKGDKPIVKEKGPYVYKLFYWKDDVDVNETEDEISYFQYMKFEFNQEASGELTDKDEVTILNLPYTSFLYTAEATEPALMPLIESGLKAVFQNNNSPFLTTSVREFLFEGVKMCEHGGSKSGFTGKVICAQVKKKTVGTKQMRVEDDNTILYATLFYKNNTHLGRFTVKSGKNNASESGILKEFNGLTSLSVWRPGENSICDKIRGVTTVFPAEVQPEMVFESFSEDICRVVKMAYKDTETVKSIEGFKFGAVNNTFSNEGENSCFCKNITINIDGNTECLYDGVVDLTACTDILTFIVNEKPKRM